MHDLAAIFPHLQSGYVNPPFIEIPLASQHYKLFI